MASSYWPAAVAASILPNIGGSIGGYLSRHHVYRTDGKPSWYDTLVKPSWTPPKWVFGPVWTCLYTSTGYASYLVWRDVGGFLGDNKLPLILYGSNLAFNWAWQPLFFNAHSFKWSLVDVILGYGNAFVCAKLFYDVNPMAGLLFVPYIAWMTLATALTYRFWRDNSNGDGAKIKELKD